MMIEELTGARIPSVWCRFGGGGMALWEIGVQV